MAGHHWYLWTTSFVVSQVLFQHFGTVQKRNAPDTIPNNRAVISIPPILTTMDMIRIRMPPLTASSENFQSNPAPATACKSCHIDKVALAPYCHNTVNSHHLLANLQFRRASKHRMKGHLPECLMQGSARNSVQAEAPQVNQCEREPQ